MLFIFFMIHLALVHCQIVLLMKVHFEINDLFTITVNGMVLVTYYYQHAVL